MVPTLAYIGPEASAGERAFVASREFARWRMLKFGKRRSRSLRLNGKGAAAGRTSVLRLTGRGMRLGRKTSEAFLGDFGWITWR